MSAETRQAGHDTYQHLSDAEYSLKQAEKSATQTKDPGLIQKVTKIKEAVTETRKELSTKLDDNAGQKR